MISSMKLLLLPSLLLTTLLPVQAAPIVVVTPTVTGPSAGQFTYSYTVDNTGSDNIWDLFLFIGGPIVSGSINAPLGWSFIADATGIDWFSLDASSDIPSSTSLSGFSFVSTATPGTVTFIASFSDPLTGVPTDAFEIDSTLGPSNQVPEPSSAGLFLFGIGILALGQWTINPPISFCCFRPPPPAAYTGGCARLPPRLGLLELIGRLPTLSRTRACRYYRG